MHIASSLYLAPVGSFWRRSVVPFTCILPAFSQAVRVAHFCTGSFFSSFSFSANFGTLREIFRSSSYSPSNVAVLLRIWYLLNRCVLLEVCCWPFCWNLVHYAAVNAQTNIPYQQEPFFFQRGAPSKNFAVANNRLGLGEISRLLTIGLGDFVGCQ